MNFLFAPHLHLFLSTETFLFYLIESFKVSPSKTEIFWNNSFAVYPSVVKGSSKAKMPLHVELIRPLSA